MAVIGRPSVSVVIIFWNGQDFIVEAIHSVFGQSYDAWELLLVDDGSTDQSTENSRQAASIYPRRVRYLEHEGHQNRGMSASRNLGIQHAAGEYIAFLDADDVWLPNKLEQQVSILDKWPQAGMVYGLSRWWYSWTGMPEDQQRDFVYDLGVPANTLIDPPDLLAPFFFQQTAAIPCPTDILLRSSALQLTGGFEEGFLGNNQSYEDQAFYAKVCLSVPVFAADTCWDLYRQHNNSCVVTVEQKGQARAARLFFLDWLAAYLKLRGVMDSEIWKALRREQARSRHPVWYRYLEKLFTSLKAYG